MNKLILLLLAAAIFVSGLFIYAPLTHAAKVFTDDDLKKFRPVQTEQPSASAPAKEKAAKQADSDKPAEEPAKPVTKSFTFYYDGALTGINISTMPAEKKVRLDIQIRSKSLYICYRDLYISQKGRTINFATAAEGDESAKFSPDSGWEGCSVIYSGVSRSAVVGPLPDWFNFKEPFSFNFRGRTLTIDQP
ncbi:MAG: hypothetical protein JXR79_04630 [Nitrospirae bacterium]|nr:hypothetical protein [Nitrospirota bacterium]